MSDHFSSKEGVSSRTVLCALQYLGQNTCSHAATEGATNKKTLFTLKVSDPLGTSAASTITMEEGPSLPTHLAPNRL